MDATQFIQETEELIYKEVAKNTNLLFGKNKTAALSTGIFLKLPIEVAVEKVDQPLPKLYKDLVTFMPYFSAYTKIGNTSKVFFTFMYHDEKDFNAISQHIHRYSMFFTFVYMHELQHILRKHVTTSYETMMKRIANDHPFSHQLINIAEDYAINYSLKEIFMAAERSRLGEGKQSTIMKDWAEIEPVGMYNKEYHNKQMSDIDILKDILANSPKISVSAVSANFESVDMNGNSSIQPIEGANAGGDKGEAESKSKPDKCSTVSDEMDNSISDLVESLQDIIRSNTKGSQAGELFEKMFEAVAVDTGWFKRIKASFKRQVFYKTHNYSTSWSNLNSTYRHIYKSPKKVFIDDKISIILSIDHSGSMSTTDLQRLLYLIESEATRIAKLTVLIHDTRVIKSFDISNEYDISKSPEFTQALATRYTSGGTSHACVFEFINNMNIKDPSQVIYMSFSDNQSDINQSFGLYPIMRKLTNYWVCTERNPVNVLGTNITMI